MGMKGFPVALLGLFLILPIWVRMQGWRLRIRHPDPRYLTTQGELYAADSRERVIDGWTLRPGRATWRPDPAAQVDEVRAQLVDEARKVDP
ncbi:MAG: hypothetical protein E6R03_13860 [Hyphomicrobiaceae bacterium]|nr:MAG: hypothetical protein E6R03_13860 [Hyphomicrobiaceae bacterium]